MQVSPFTAAMTQHLIQEIRLGSTEKIQKMDERKRWRNLFTCVKADNVGLRQDGIVCIRGVRGGAGGIWKYRSG